MIKASAPEPNTFKVFVIVFVKPGTSITSMAMTYVPSSEYWWLAVLTVEYSVSHVPSFSQSQRTFNSVVGLSLSELAEASKRKFVVTSPDDGFIVKDAVGGLFGLSLLLPFVSFSFLHEFKNVIDKIKTNNKT